MMVQVPSSAQLHDQVYLGPRINNLIESHYVSVVYVSKHVNLTMQRRGSFLFLKVTLFICLQSEYMSGVAVGASLDNGVSAGANLQANIEVVIVKHLFRRRRLFSFASFVFRSPFIVLIDHDEELLFAPGSPGEVNRNILKYLLRLLEQILLANT